MTTTSGQRTQRVRHIGKIAAVIAATGAAVAACGGDDGATSSPGTDTATESAAAASGAAETEPSSTAAGSSAYNDGEYSATGTYDSPGGEQSIGVTVTLSNSVITALTLDTSETRGTSAEFQGKFASGIDALVVGKNIDELEVSKVSGSSLTSGGFNAAIEQIQTEAQA